MPKRTTSTIGLNRKNSSAINILKYDLVVKVNVDNFVLNFWDVGGNKELLSLWDRYIEDCHAIVFVVDPCGDDYIEDCLRALSKHFRNYLKEKN
jgi:GTPase SAR1 family protein